MRQIVKVRAVEANVSIIAIFSENQVCLQYYHSFDMYIRAA